MAFHLICKSKGAKYYKILFSFLLIIISLSSVAGAKNNGPINIGAIIDVDSRVGKEQQTAMKMAARRFNSVSNNHSLVLHFRNISYNNPIQAVSAAEELIGENQVKLIVGLPTWEQSVLVADVGERAQIPVLSLASTSYNKPLLMNQRWPFLLPMVPNSSDQIKCIAAMIDSFDWRKVVAIYEDNSYGGDSELIGLLSEALQAVDAEIESHLVLPPPSSVSDLEGMVRDEVLNLKCRSQSRVFVVLRSSLPLANCLFKEAKKVGLMGRDTVWIIADSVSDLLDSVDSSFISSIQGALGIKAHYLENTKPFLKFKRVFEKNFRSEFPDERSSEPGIHALRAYDAITAVSRSVKELSTSSISFLRTIKSANNSNGLSSDVRFQGESESESVFTIVSVIGKSYKEHGIWSFSRLGFADGITKPENWDQIMQNLTSSVIWPGGLHRIPKGWAMPTDEEPMRIVVPGEAVFQEFVKVDWSSNKNKPSGFCIDIFEEALKIVEEEYALPYKYEPFNGSYEELIGQVINMKYSAAVGDITILANRSKYVDFTHPFTESGLSMVVKVKPEFQKAWMFMKPFTINMWIATFSIIFYTMFVVWFMEHQTNPEFRGSWRDQLATAMWFTFSTLFFAHKENVKSYYSKAVLAVWLFLVFVLTSSYTASLTSMLTVVSRLEPNVTNIEWLRRTNASVGCDDKSFVKDYLHNVLNLTNIKTVNSPASNYPGEFDSRNISAAYLELPYQKVFFKDNCKDYAVTGPTYRFGGLGFAFQKGNPIARNFSGAILTLMDNGTLDRLRDKWFGTTNCSSSENSDKTASLKLESFLGLFLISGSTTTIWFLIFLARLWKKARRINVAQRDTGIKGILNSVVELVPQPLKIGKLRSMTF